MYNSGGGGKNPQGEKKTNLNGWSKIQELNNVKCYWKKIYRIYAKNHVAIYQLWKKWNNLQC